MTKKNKNLITGVLVFAVTILLAFNCTNIDFWKLNLYEPELFITL